MAKPGRRPIWGDRETVVVRATLPVETAERLHSFAAGASVGAWIARQVDKEALRRERVAASINAGRKMRAERRARSADEGDR